MSVQLPEQLGMLLILVGLPPHKRRHFKQLFILPVCVSLIYWHYYQLQYKTWCGSWPNEGRRGRMDGAGLGLPVGETASAQGVLLEIKFVKMAMANSIFINCKSRRVQLPHMESNPTPATAPAPATLVPSYPRTLLPSYSSQLLILPCLLRAPVTCQANYVNCMHILGNTRPEAEQSLLDRGSALPLIGFGNIIIRKYKLFAQNQGQVRQGRG